MAKATWENRLTEGKKGHKQVFQDLLQEAGILDDEYFSVNELTEYGFKLSYRPMGGSFWDFLVYYTPSGDEWIISCEGEDNSECDFIDVSQLSLNDPDEEIGDYGMHAPIQERGTGFNNLIESLIGGQWTAFYEVDWDKRAKYFD